MRSAKKDVKSVPTTNARAPNCPGVFSISSLGFQLFVQKNDIPNALSEGSELINNVMKKDSKIKIPNRPKRGSAFLKSTSLFSLKFTFNTESSIIYLKFI